MGKTEPDMHKPDIFRHCTNVVYVCKLQFDLNIGKKIYMIYSVDIYSKKVFIIVFSEICMESFKDSNKDMTQAFMNILKQGVVYRGKT